MSLAEEIEFDAVKSHGPVAVQQFTKLLLAGESPRMAAMLATRTAPRLGINDQTYMANKPSLLEQFNGSEIVMENWKRQYKLRTGEDLPDDAYIFRGLADGPGDPSAVLTHKVSLSDIKRMCHEKGKYVEGDWDITPEERPPVIQETKLAPDIVERYRAEYIAENPDLAHMDQEELRAQIVETHGVRRTADDLEPFGATSFADLNRKLFGEVSSERMPVEIGGRSERAEDGEREVVEEDRTAGDDSVGDDADRDEEDE
jgi:hypothetical protein